MVKFIILTAGNGDKKVYVNPNQICNFYSSDDDGSIIQFADVSNTRWVKETPEEIKEMIDNVSTMNMPLKEKAKDSKQYIRFGDFPEDKISKAHRGDAIIKVEEGLSVWDCAFVNDVPFPLLPENASESAMADYFYMLLGDKPVYLVSGTELESVGSAGEPLLGTDVHIVRDYTEDYKYLKAIHTRNKEDEKDPGIKYLHWRYITGTNDHPCDTGDRLVAYYDKDGRRRVGRGYYTPKEWSILFGDDWKVWDRVYAWADISIDDFLTCDAPDPKTPIAEIPLCNNLKYNDYGDRVGKFFTVNSHSDVCVGDEVKHITGTKGLILKKNIDEENGVDHTEWIILWRQKENILAIGKIFAGDNYALTGVHYDHMSMEDLIRYGGQEYGGQ